MAFAANKAHREHGAVFTWLRVLRHCGFCVINVVADFSVIAFANVTAGRTSLRTRSAIPLTRPIGTQINPLRIQLLN